MCEVIALTPRSVPRPAPAGGSAEILFFMGVRYHRMSDDEFEQAIAARPRVCKSKTSRSEPRARRRS